MGCAGEKGLMLFSVFMFFSKGKKLRFALSEL